MSAWQTDQRLSPLWIGVCGATRELTVAITPLEGRSPQLWFGPHLAEQAEFCFQLALHTGMGPGGILWRRDAASPWTSLTSTAGWGAERIGAVSHWSVGCDRDAAPRMPFRGPRLEVRWQSQVEAL